MLQRAGAATAALEEGLAVTIAREEYGQLLLVGRDSSPRVTRKLISDVAWVPTGDAIVWAFVRDVLSVDGEAVSNRAARLDALFEGGAGPEARERATRILAVWLPAEMQEAYGNRTRSAGEERVEATARYSDYRQARVELLPISRSARAGRPGSSMFEVVIGAGDTPGVAVAPIECQSV